MAMRGPRHPIGAAPWIVEERTTALHIAQSETEEFSFSVKNEMDWLNEHMAEIFSENQISVAEIFKTPGKLRGKTPRTARTVNRGDIRAPLTDVFLSTPKGVPNPFAISKRTGILQQQQQRRNSPTFKVAEDRPNGTNFSPRVSPAKVRVSAAAPLSIFRKNTLHSAQKASAFARKPEPASSLGDSGYHGSQDMTDQDDDDVDVDVDVDVDMDADADDLAMSVTRPGLQPTRQAASGPKAASIPTNATPAARTPMERSTTPLLTSPDEARGRRSPTQPDHSFHSAREEPTEDMLPQAAVSSDDVPVSSSPFVPVKSPSPVRAAMAVSPQRKPVPPPMQPQEQQEQQEPSSPLQSTTPAFPPPQELLTAMGQLPADDSLLAPSAPTSPMVTPSKTQGHVAMEEEVEAEAEDEQENAEAPQSPDVDTSPARPVVRKSSLNFASLPAREPFTSNKSIGGAARPSRTSHTDMARVGYYNRVTGGKSLGNVRPAEREDGDNGQDELDADDVFSAQDAMQTDEDATSDNKTYTQRLQDRISMLGKSQASGPRPSKSLANHLPGATQNMLSALAQPQRSQPPAPLSSPKKIASPVLAPGAFPEEDDEDWIMPPPDTDITSPRLHMPENYASTDTDEEQEVADSQPNFVLPKQRQSAVAAASPLRTKVMALREDSPRVNGHVKSASVPTLPLFAPDLLAAWNPVSVSNPTDGSGTGLTIVTDMRDVPSSPTKSPSRTFRDSPLRQVKSKLTSIIKSSKGLLASSAALSAEGKSSLLSPSTLRLGMNLAPSTESLALRHGSASAVDLGYPDLSRQIAAAKLLFEGDHSADQAAASAEPGSPVRVSPVRTNIRKTRASTERERREQKIREKEEKETLRMEDRFEKLEKEREKEREKARIFSEEQDKMAQKEQKEQEQNEQKELLQKQAQLQQSAQDDDELNADDYTQRQPTVQEQQKPVSSPSRAPAKPTKSSPRKAKTQQLEPDADMEEASQNIRPHAHSTVLANASVPRSAQAKRTIRRPVKPTKEAPSKAKQAPTVIRVNTSSSQQQSQFHPSNSALAATLHETLMGPQQSQSQSQSHQLKSKASAASLHTKPSLQSLKSSVSSTGRPKALDLAARRKEQEEREAQRKRDYKAELERKRAVNQEQEEQRRLDQQKEREAEVARKATAAAQLRQAAIEKAKQTRAPPPAPRTQLPSGPSDYGRSETAGQQPSRPQSRLATATSTHRSQDETHRPVNAVLSNAGKPLSKRPLPATDHAQAHGRSVAANSGNASAYQAKEAKRIRLSEEFDEDELEMGGHIPRVSSIKGPPVRPSGVFKKDLPNKSLYGNGYATAPSTANISRDLFKTTVTSQHNHQMRAGHPLDMAQVSKATISFASNINAVATATASAASSSAAPNPHKTPARPVGVPLTSKSTAKSAARSSPRYPNGDGIELPEIQTDDEDSDEDSNVNVAPWADSPDLRRALMQQETMDPMQVFGPPRPLNMEEVFSKSKDRWNKFRARTSSANWSGTDRLTEDDIRKDLAARDKIRREGGWTYELNKDMM